MAQPSIKKNYIYNTLYEILAIIAPLITAPYVSRIFQAGWRWYFQPYREYGSLFCTV